MTSSKIGILHSKVFNKSAEDSWGQFSMTGGWRALQASTMQANLLLGKHVG